MSFRALRKLREKQEHQLEDPTQDGSDDSTENFKVSQPKINAFELLENEGPGESFVSDTSSVQQLQIPAERSRPSKPLNNKKKKKKKKLTKKSVVVPESKHNGGAT